MSTDHTPAEKRIPSILNEGQLFDRDESPMAEEMVKTAREQWWKKWLKTKEAATTGEAVAADVQ